ncbi:hypothetical protein ACHAXH_002317 [Discostella pseudostelligera]
MPHPYYYTSAIILFQCSLVCGNSNGRCDGSFIRGSGTGSFARSLPRRHRDHNIPIASTYVASKLLSSKTSSHQCGKNNFVQTKTDYLSDRRLFIVSSAFGAGSMIGGVDAAVGYGISIDDKRQSNDSMNSDLPITVTLPLEPASGGTFCVRFTIYPTSDSSDCRAIFGGGSQNNVEDSFRLFRAIVDTGSPYLVLPSSTSMNDMKTTPKWISTAFACTERMNESNWFPNSKYDPTEEIYGAVKGQVHWKLARYEFRDPLLHTISNSDGENYSSFHQLSYTPRAVGVVGVLDDALTNEATGGGVTEPFALLGLIRNNNPNADKTRFPNPRPSFLEQESLSTGNNNDSNMTEQKECRIKSFCINGPRRELKFSTQSMIPATAPALRLVDLRHYGDFVDHYAAVVDSLTLDGVTVASRSLKQFGGSMERPIVAVFDTGLTGCLLIRQFWDVLQKCMTANAANASEIRSASLSLRTTCNGNMKNDISACKLMSNLEVDPRFYVKPIDLDWFDDEQNAPYVIILGQTFLSRGALTIDLDERLAAFNLANG